MGSKVGSNSETLELLDQGNGDAIDENNRYKMGKEVWVERQCIEVTVEHSGEIPRIQL